MTRFGAMRLRYEVCGLEPSDLGSMHITLRLFCVLQVQLGSHSFTFDHVYGSTGTPLAAIFDECVAPLVDGLFQGFNATVLAYGQVSELVLSTQSSMSCFVSCTVCRRDISHTPKPV